MNRMKVSQVVLLAGATTLVLLLAAMINPISTQGFDAEQNQAIQRTFAWINNLEIHRTYPTPDNPDPDGYEFKSPHALLRATELNLDCGDVGNADLVHLKHLTSLEKLNLSMTPVGSGQGLQNTGGLLPWKWIPVSQGDFTHLSRLTKLRNLALRSSRIDNSDLEQIGKLSSLESLDLQNNAISDAGLKFLEPLKSLKVLAISYTNVSESGVATLKKQLPDCKVIYQTPKTNHGKNQDSKFRFAPHD